MSVALSGSSVLVTGASGGIGEAIARALHDRGATLVLNGRRAEVLERLKSELGDRAEVAVADLADREQVAGLAERCSDVDVLVANAALPASGRVDEFSPEEIDRALEVNLRAPIQLGRALAPRMVERGRGQLVFVNSLSGKASAGGGAIYSATKFGLRGFALGLREDLRDTGVGVTSVFPGFIREAGMFAESGAKLPPGVGTSTPAEVADALIDGIERDRAEVDVAPLPVRAGAFASVLAPTTVAALRRRLGGRQLAEEMARGQASKR